MRRPLLLLTALGAAVSVVRRRRARRSDAELWREATAGASGTTNGTAPPAR